MGKPSLTSAPDAASAWEDFRVEVEEFRELDDERVLVLSRMSARGKASGLELGQIQTRAAHVVHLRDSKVVKLVGYWDRERAFADLGLAPNGDPEG